VTKAPLCLMAVHAHPDDEAAMTGGILAKYAAEGITTVLVVCTDGALGDQTTGATPTDEHHEPESVAAHRHQELLESCKVLSISHLETLGYRDSGMAGWPQNDVADSFWQTPVADSAARLAALIEHYRPQVVVTYDENGFYGHPDHIQANRITKAALEMVPSVEKLFYTAIPKSVLAGFRQALAEEGSGDPDAELPDEFGTEDDQIGAVIDVAQVVDKKRASLQAHASQTDSSFFLAMAPERFAQAFGQEAFVSVFDSTSRQGIDDDLFARLR
jgi:LmbE family N-acetylglucosaminyl deacetylase